MINVAINGSLGRMGLTLLEAISLNDKTKLGAVFERPSNAHIGTLIESFTPHYQGDIQLQSEWESVLDDFEVIIDFSSIEGTLETLKKAQKHHKPLVIGTTGLNDHLPIIEQYALSIPILFAPNMSLGVNVLLTLLKQTTQRLKKLDYDIEILEAHHRHKIDAPSGTALKMGEVIAEELGIDYRQDGVFCRSGQTGVRLDNTIGYQTLRGGDIVGEHTAYFITDGERLEITHKASSRMTFAKGAVSAAAWLVTQPNGLYDINNLLNSI